MPVGEDRQGEDKIQYNYRMKTRPLTFLLSLTFLFLFGCSQTMMYAKDNSSDQNWGKDYADCYSQAKGYFGLQLWNSIVHNCLVGRGYNAVDKEGNPIQYNPFTANVLMPVHSKK